MSAAAQLVCCVCGEQVPSAPAAKDAPVLSLQCGAGHSTCVDCLNGLAKVDAGIEGVLSPSLLYRSEVYYR